MPQKKKAVMHASPLNFENGSLFGHPVLKQPV